MSHIQFSIEPTNQMYTLLDCVSEQPVIVCISMFMNPGQNPGITTKTL